MERENLFRGKRADNGEWIEGVPYDEYMICGMNLLRADDEIPISEYPEFDYVRIIPETIGQHTGLRDKNKVRIFEGDIIKTKKYGKDVGDCNVNDYDIFVVTYEPCMFRLINRTRSFCLDDDGYSKLEVIGNIHDNPELLKSKG